MTKKLCAYFIYWCAFTILAFTWMISMESSKMFLQFMQECDFSPVWIISVFECSSPILAWIRLFTCKFDKENVFAIFTLKTLCTLHSDTTFYQKIVIKSIVRIWELFWIILEIFATIIGAIFFHVVRSCGQALHLLAQNLRHNRYNDFSCFGWC